MALFGCVLELVSTSCEEKISLCLFHIIFFFPFGRAFFIQEENVFGICSHFRDFYSKQQAGFPFLSYPFVYFIILFYLTLFILAPFSSGAGDERYGGR